MEEDEGGIWYGESIKFDDRYVGTELDKTIVFHSYLLENSKIFLQIF